MGAPGRRIVLDPTSRQWRRQLGPMVWAVLEDLALDAEDDAAGEVARSSARRVAEHLGIQPGTAAKALNRLRDQGLVRLVREPGAAGRFGLSVYQLAEIPGLTLIDTPPPRVDPPHMDAPHVVTPNTAPPTVASPRMVTPYTVPQNVGPALAGIPPVVAVPLAVPNAYATGWGWRHPDDEGDASDSVLAVPADGSAGPEPLLSPAWDTAGPPADPVPPEPSRPSPRAKRPSPGQASLWEERT